MKKFFFIAAMASVAFVSCVKNDPAPSVTEQSAITFAAPVVGNLTKAVAGEIGTAYDVNESFNVYGWYCTENSFNPANASVYMNNVTCSYDSSIDKTEDTGSGAWIPATTYYWPKNGKLTFSAYSPSDLTAKSISNDVTTGLYIQEFSTNADVTKQFDLLYSDRAYNKTTSIGATNDTYDGVDIVFRHALSSIHVKVKTNAEYPANTITVNDISFANVYTTADFKENLTTGTETESNATAAWEGHMNPTSVTVGSTGVAVTSTATQYGTTALLIPQTFAATASKDVATLIVNYTIKNEGGTTIDQVATFSLEAPGTINGADAGTIMQWTKGYRYTYNLVFGLNEIYFAPSVETWYDVTMNDMVI
ncbi:MAG: fimbrillin family protein [Bacteroidales bacterium]|nr:fimbrillin family protein [Bacteroidales bacterium]